MVTIEPGFYIAPDIINDPKLYETFRHDFNWSRLEEWIGFGGIRIEDDVLITNTGSDVITDDIPKRIEDIEALVGSIGD